MINPPGSFIKNMTGTSRELIASKSHSIDYTWTAGDESTISHVRVIDSGAGGEVHEVALPIFEWTLLTPSYLTSDLAKYSAKLVDPF